MSIRKILKKYFLMNKFKEEFKIFKKLSNESRFSINWNDRYPCIGDNTCGTDFERHYTYHPAWAARILALTNPECHVDISSTLNFSTIVSAFIPTRFYDYRPANINLDNLTSEAINLLELDFKDNSIKSLSCMHVVEHIGLGRYGDPINSDGDLKAISELKRVLATDGTLLFVVPIGKPRIQFNAHRIYSYEQILTYFSDLELEEFTLIPDKAEDGDLVKNAPKELADAQNYACGCFWFKKS